MSCYINKTSWTRSALTTNRNDGTSNHFQKDLISPWGIVVFNEVLWVCANKTSFLFGMDLYGGFLSKTTLKDKAHNTSFPTGIAVNCGGNFVSVSDDSITSGELLLATESGSIHSFNRTKDLDSVFDVVLNTQFTGNIFVFTGLCVANNLLYVADFYNRRIFVYDSAYNQQSDIMYPFVDQGSPPISEGFAPYNIVRHGDYLFVIWAQRNPNISSETITGRGSGAISVFTLDGKFVRRFSSIIELNAPWAFIRAPPLFELQDVGGKGFLVGNSGDGRILIFDEQGNYRGPLLDQKGLPLTLYGLKGLAPKYCGPDIKIFYTSSAGETGIVGVICPTAKITFS